MAVINIDPNERWNAINQALGGAAARIIQAYSDQAAMKRVMDAAGGKGSTPNSSSLTEKGSTLSDLGSPGMPPQFGQSDALSRDITPTSAGGTITPIPNNPATVSGGVSQGPGIFDETGAYHTPTPPDPVALMQAAGTSPVAQKLAGAYIKGYQLQLQRERDYFAERRNIRQEQLARISLLEKYQEEPFKLRKLSAETTTAEGKAANVPLEQQKLQSQTAVEQAKEANIPLEQQKLNVQVQSERAGLELKRKQIQEKIQQQANILKPEELQKMAENYAAMGFKTQPNFGWGTSGANAINRIGFQRAVLNLPLTPDQRRQAVLGFQEQETALKRAGTTLSNLTININKADQLMKPIDRSLKNLEPLLTKSPMFNRFKRAIITGVGDPAFSQADIYTRSFMIAYLKALNPNGIATVDMDRSISGFLDTVSSPAQLKAKIEAIKNDMEYERNAVQAGTSDLLKGTNVNSGALGAAGQPNTGSDDNPAGLDLGQ